MSQTQETQCTQLIHYDGAHIGQKELKEALEKGNTDSQVEHMKQMIMLHLNGEPQSAMLMTFIRFVLPKQDHKLKKLALYFLEIIDKTDSSGKLLPEMILVCNFIRNDLQHPNEYVRGCTLRFVSKIREQELVEPLTDSIMANLDHRHSYVRRNAVLCLMAVYQRFPHLFPDAPELVEASLDKESDVTTKRNSFLMLFNCAQERAVRYLRKAIDVDIDLAGESFQLALVDLLRHLCKTSPAEKAKYLSVIFNLLSSRHAAVLFQCASTLQSLASSRTAIREAAHTFVKLLTTHADNNVKLIVIDRLEAIKKRFPDILCELLTDLLRTLSSPNMDLRRRILDLSLDLTTNQNVEKAVQFLKKEVLRTQEDTSMVDKQASNEYRQLLVRSIHQCTVKHPHVAGLIVPVLSDYLVDVGPSAVDVMLFIREILLRQPQLRDEILAKLIDVFGSISSPRVLRILLWVLGTYCKSADEVMSAMSAIKTAIGAFPLVPIEKAAGEDTTNRQRKGAETADAAGDVAKTTNTTISKDGTYVTTVTESAPIATDSGELPLRTLLATGDFFLASALCNTLVKFVLMTQRDDRQHFKTELKMDSMEIVNELLRLGAHSKPPIDNDSHERIVLCLALLQNVNTVPSKALVDGSVKAFTDMLQETASTVAEVGPAAPAPTNVPVDSTIKFSQFSKDKHNRLEEEDETEDSTNLAGAQGKKSAFISRLDRVIQLTGFSDPVYAEAMVTVNQFDISLDILVVNQSPHLLQSLTVELATQGDLKLCERPETYTLAPKEQVNLRVNIKVSSTDTGIIFGNIVYDGPGAAAERQCVILNDIHIDIMDYISPATCAPTAFRSMWAEFEWENKVVVNTDIKSLREFLDHIMQNTNMRSLTSDNFIQGDCDFLSANLYAKSSFGEDALANVSIERHPDGRIEGLVRIRSKTQGIALGLGDKITLKQRG
eukprot:GGOE01019192.1.p1 GENE.GGOE01019192.1~~GGOE01019192.1.p1  ORF type:complete len:946 (+),score=251.86 GGOE01019192.1:38-2875(+)